MTDHSHYYFSSPSEVAWQRILANEGPPKVLSIYRQLFNDSEDLDDRGFTGLHRVILRLDGRDLRTYLRICPQTDINRGDAQGWTPLQWATRRCDFDMVEMLLQGGADPNISINKHRITAPPLHYAVRNGDLRSVDHLLKYGADMNALDSTHSTALLHMFTFSQFHLACAKRLIDKGAAIDLPDFQGATSLGFASQNGCLVGMRLLLENGANIDFPSFEGETALTAAVQVNAHGSISLLLEHGASVVQYTVLGRSLLHEAAEYGDEETLRLLTLARIRGVQIQRRSTDGNTAWALAQKRAEVTLEWRAAFADLIASVDEGVAEPPSAPELPSQRVQFPRFRPSSMMKAVEDRLCEGAEWVQGYMSRLPRSRIQAFFALLTVCLAIAWYMLLAL